MYWDISTFEGYLSKGATSSMPVVSADGKTLSINVTLSKPGDSA